MEIRETSLEKIIFENTEGFIIALGKDQMTYKGTVLENPKDLLNTQISFEGTITNYKDKKQFSFTTYTVQLSFTDFFLEKMVKGLSKKSIVDIKLKCGDNFEKIINESPELLLSIKGVGEKSISKIIKSYNENKHLKKVADFLLPFGITNNAIKKIYDKYNNNAIEILNNNPYTLMEIKGISFKKADDIAVKIGLPLNSTFRLNSGIEFAINEYFNSQGHTSIEKEIFFEKAADTLNTEGFNLTLELFEKHLRILIGEESICTLNNFENIYTNKKFKMMETYIFEKLSHYKNIKADKCLNEDIETHISNFEKSNNMQLDERQKDAIRLVNSQYRCVYLAGFAGTGKSTSSKTSMKLYEDAYGYSSVVGCALSGIAAQRIQTVTGYKSYTIHTLLGYRGGNDFEYNEENKLPYKFIMIDESSMIDTYLFYKLLCAIDLEETAIIIVGDPSQLKAVAPGNVFEDIIEKKILYGVKLEKVFRQSNDQMINVFATNYIRNGIVPEEYKAENYKDFKFHTFEIENAFRVKNQVSQNEYQQLQNNVKNQILEKIKEIAYSNINTLSYWKNDVWKYITNFQIITPMKAGQLGAENLNILIQSVFNSSSTGEVLKTQNKEFRFRDKVIHLQNEKMHTITTEQYKEYSSKNLLSEVLKEETELARKTQRVFNGQLGVIININTVNDIISVYYPNEGYVTLYKSENFKQRKIDLAYAITIHKSQGMEYNTVLLPMTYSHYVMLNNNLLYTAITRAKSSLHIIGESSAFEYACKNKDIIKRNSVIQTLRKEKIA